MKLVASDVYLLNSQIVLENQSVAAFWLFDKPPLLDDSIARQGFSEKKLASVASREDFFQKTRRV